MTMWPMPRTFVAALFIECLGKIQGFQIHTDMHIQEECCVSDMIWVP